MLAIVPFCNASTLNHVDSDQRSYWQHRKFLTVFSIGALMQFDDRLATVMRMRTESDAALRTQFRQLLDILGTRDTPLEGRELAEIAHEMHSRDDISLDTILDERDIDADDRQFGSIMAFIKLDALQRMIPQEEQSLILREPGVRLRDPQFVAFLADGAPKSAAAAMATARLSESDWLEIIPNLPVTARGFLRHRRDLTPRVKRLLAQLGISDLVLPAANDGDAATSPSIERAPPESGIGALRRRIEAFQERRPQGSPAPRLPLGDVAANRDPARDNQLDVITDASGTIVQTDSINAPLLIGLRLASAKPGELVAMDGASKTALKRRQPLVNAPLTISSAQQISGEWRMSATPLFDQETGAFTGYAARLLRPNIQADDEANIQGDAMRQVLHELRTPVNAIQGFAEIIQQQLFGNVPHEYRAHAAAIAVDSAKLLAGFDEVDRLVKLESGALALEDGQSDFRLALVETMRRLDGVLRPRNAGFSLTVRGHPFHVAMAREEAMVICWRLLATAAGALGPGEESELELSSDGSNLTLRLDVPEALRNAPSETQRKTDRRKSVSAGMYGPSFAFRLATAEAQAAGGSLVCEGQSVTLHLPTLGEAALTGQDSAHSSDGEASGG